MHVIQASPSNVLMCTGLQASNATHITVLHTTQAPDRNAPPLRSYQVEGLPDEEGLAQQYSTIAAALGPHVDLLLCETLSTVKEVSSAAMAAAAQGEPANTAATQTLTMSAITC
jgi:hypothetical protein